MGVALCRLVFHEADNCAGTFRGPLVIDYLVASRGFLRSQKD